MSCSMEYCPIQRRENFECNLTSSQCPNYSEKIDYEKVYENFCNHIADLVVEKLKGETK